MNKTDQQNLFCFTHSTYSITFICTTCHFVPVCNKCVVFKGIHFGHEIIEIEDESVEPILKEMNEKTIPRLDELIKNYENLLNKNDQKYDDIEKKHKSNLQLVSNEIGKLHTILQTIENNLSQQLITNLDENNDICMVFKMKVHEELKVISKVVALKNEYNFIDESNNKHIQIIKDSYQSKNILTNHFSYPPEYSNSVVSISSESIDSVKDLFNKMVTIDKVNQKKDQELQHQQEKQHGNSTPKEETKIKWNKFSFGMRKNTISLGIGQGEQSQPRVILKAVKRGSIPSAVEKIYFCDGFGQRIAKGIIPKSVKEVFLFDIVHASEKGSIPNTVSLFGCSPSFEHFIENHSTNAINDLVYAPEKGSIPNTVSFVEKKTYSHQQMQSTTLFMLQKNCCSPSFKITQQM
ncbi:hypothetical protein RB653_010142 [Dictyostelium firmibasis]|uniref:B box-type domain-containing protein n=1 Tax=Dictyostelium firmibasis TaxID=79012 RepID=A0AAN7TTA9_9MYCE